MKQIDKDRNTLQRLVESYGKKDVLNYVKHLNEASNARRYQKPIWSCNVDLLSDWDSKEECGSPMTPECKAYCKAYKQLAHFVPIYEARNGGGMYGKDVCCYTSEQCQMFYDFMLDHVLWDNGELCSEGISFLCPGLKELVTERRPELEGDDE